jgi:hypothetical protein
VTLMLEAGARRSRTFRTRSEDQVGHEDTKTTQKIYARVLFRQQRDKAGAALTS